MIFLPAPCFRDGSVLDNQPPCQPSEKGPAGKYPSGPSGGSASSSYAVVFFADRRGDGFFWAAAPFSFCPARRLFFLALEEASAFALPAPPAGRSSINEMGARSPRRQPIFTMRV